MLQLSPPPVCVDRAGRLISSLFSGSLSLSLSLSLTLRVCVCVCASCCPWGNVVIVLAVLRMSMFIFKRRMTIWYPSRRMRN